MDDRQGPAAAPRCSRTVMEGQMAKTIMGAVLSLDGCIADDQAPAT
jgi:hypothetical protein